MQPAQSPAYQNLASLANKAVADMDSHGQASSNGLQDHGPRQLSLAADSEQPEATIDRDVVQASTQEISTSTTSCIPTPQTSTDPPAGMMLFPISQIQQVLDIYDRRKQRIQYLEAQVDDLEQTLKKNNPTLVANRDGTELTKNNAAQGTQPSLAAALARALVRQANITDLNQLYSLFEDLDVDETHYWALYDNEEFRRHFPASHDNDNAKSRSKSAEVERANGSPLPYTLDTINRMPASSAAISARTAPSKPKDLPPT
jgi:hypothetical protein